MRAYYYLYYRIYKFIKKLGNYDIFFMTSYNVTLFESYFFMSIYVLLYKLNIVKKVEFIPILIAISIFLALNYFIFVYKKRYEQIIKMFQNETKRQKRISSAVVLGIFILNTFLFIYGIIILWWSFANQIKKPQPLRLRFFNEQAYTVYPF